MDPSPKTGLSDTSDNKTVGYGQGKDQGPFEEDKQEIELEEGSQSQENIFCMAFSDQFSVMSPYL
jgi:hypothetical protein